MLLHFYISPKSVLEHKHRALCICISMESGMTDAAATEGAKHIILYIYIYMFRTSIFNKSCDPNLVDPACTIAVFKHWLSFVLCQFLSCDPKLADPACNLAVLIYILATVHSGGNPNPTPALREPRGGNPANGHVKAVPDFHRFS